MACILSSTRHVHVYVSGLTLGISIWMEHSNLHVSSIVNTMDINVGRSVDIFSTPHHPYQLT